MKPSPMDMTIILPTLSVHVSDERFHEGTFPLAVELKSVLIFNSCSGPLFIIFIFKISVNLHVGEFFLKAMFSILEFQRLRNSFPYCINSCKSFFGNVLSVIFLITNDGRVIPNNCKLK